MGGDVFVPSALIASAGNNANEYLAKHVAELGYLRPTIVASGGEARRRMGDIDFEVLAKPFTGVQFRQAVQMAAACCRRLDYLRQENDKLRDKIAQIRLVDRAKCYLIEHKGMSEAEAHRMIEKTAMDTRRDRAEVAAEILEEE